MEIIIQEKKALTTMTIKPSIATQTVTIQVDKDIQTEQVIDEQVMDEQMDEQNSIFSQSQNDIEHQEQQAEDSEEFVQMYSGSDDSNLLSHIDD